MNNGQPVQGGLPPQAGQPAAQPNQAQQPAQAQNQQQNAAQPANGAAPQGVATVNSQAVKPTDVTAAANTSVKPAKPYNPFLVPVPPIPTQEGPMGIRYDFNDGARVLLPKGVRA